ncbi:DUF1540 domain-containing protein [Candidatus Formimonas warabiya]|uniref:DUF1540 domain-containing protein n=1 Tax=Formimonas warabiya TaxID=1761012 RepID=A0A3G1L1F8_FORW1|nr:DUF1540 domain-containing protein [Candidatus Formimonas warabiya]ATW28315.1 DUF1540 domain-containing protein [Candidatus Formimonas warabiya]
MRVEKSDAITRVKCVVNTCEYYQSGDHCTASKIEIQPQNASDTQDTDCATFVTRR